MFGPMFGNAWGILGQCLGNVRLDMFGPCSGNVLAGIGQCSASASALRAQWFGQSWAISRGAFGHGLAQLYAHFGLTLFLLGRIRIASEQRAVRNRD